MYTGFYFKKGLWPIKFNIIFNCKMCPVSLHIHGTFYYLFLMDNRGVIGKFRRNYMDIVYSHGQKKLTFLCVDQYG